MRKTSGYRFTASVITALAAVFLGGTGLTGAKQLTDPYVIFEKSLEAQGGKEKILAVKTVYREGTIKVAGLSGTFKLWEQPPGMNRSELDLQAIKQSGGDNGTVQWQQDTNGKVTVDKNELINKRRDVMKRLQRLEHLNRKSKRFSLRFKGVERVNNKWCYVIETANTITDEIEIDYIGRDDFLPFKNIKKRPDNEVHTEYSAYKKVGGILKPYHLEVFHTATKQKYVFHFDHVRLNVPLKAGFFDPPKSRAHDFVFPGGKTPVKVPFRYIDSHLYLDVVIGNKKTLWCLDSGASMTVIDREFAKELGLTLSGSVRGQAVSRQVETAFVTLPGFSVKDIRFSPQQAAAIPLRRLFKSYGIGVDGILGYDFLSRFVTRIDFSARTLEFYLPSAFKYKGGGSVVEAPLNENIFTVPVTVDDKYKGLWRVDIGAGQSDFHYYFARDNGFLKRSGVDRLAAGVGGTFGTRMLRFKSIKIGDFTIDKPVLQFPTAELSGAFSRKELTGNLGNTVLRHLVLYLDYRNQQIIFEKGKDFNRQFPEDRSGLLLALNDNGQLAVTFVSHGTPAHKAGLQRGDIIMSVNGKKIPNGRGLFSTQKIFMQKPGIPVTMTYYRAGKREKTVEMTLRDLFEK